MNHTYSEKGCFMYNFTGCDFCLKQSCPVYFDSLADMCPRYICEKIEDPDKGIIDYLWSEYLIGFPWKCFFYSMLSLATVGLLGVAVIVLMIWILREKIRALWDIVTTTNSTPTADNMEMSDLPTHSLGSIANPHYEEQDEGRLSTNSGEGEAFFLPAPPRYNLFQNVSPFAHVCTEL